MAALRKVRQVEFDPVQASGVYVPLVDTARKGARGLFMIGEAGGEGWSGKFGWYAVQTAPRQERSMVEKLREEGFEAFTPIEVKNERVRNGRGSKRGKPLYKRTERAFFPGYLFIQVKMTGRLWNSLRAENGIVGIVSVSLDGLPTVLPDHEIEPLRQHGPFKVEKPKPYKVGDLVRVNEGPFASFEALIHTVDREDRIGVFISIFGRQTPAEFHVHQVEPTAGRPRPRPVLP